MNTNELGKRDKMSFFEISKCEFRKKTICPLHPRFAFGCKQLFLIFFISQNLKNP